MKRVVVMQFNNGKALTLDEYCSLEVQRNGKQLNINATNANPNKAFAFNELYDNILEELGDDTQFTVILEEGARAATFGGISVDYYNNSMEILHFANRANEDLGRKVAELQGIIENLQNEIADLRKENA